MTAGPILLLTRPTAQSQDFLNLCERRLDRPVTAVISPIMKIEKTGEPWNLDGATLVVTSANAVRALSGAIKGRSVVTVGEATADLARANGAVAQCLGETADAFLAQADSLIPPVVVARGVHARLDLAEALISRGTDARSVTVYDQIAAPLSEEARDLLSGTRSVVAPVFSPRSAILLAAHSITAPLEICAISAAVAQAWTGPGRVRVADHPTAEAMCDLVTTAL